MQFYAAGDYVLWEDDISTDMYFIIEGMLEVRINVGRPTVQADDDGVFPTTPWAAVLQACLGLRLHTSEPLNRSFGARCHCSQSCMKWSDSCTVAACMSHNCAELLQQGQVNGANSVSAACQSLSWWLLDF